MLMEHVRVVVDNGIVGVLVRGTREQDGACNNCLGVKEEVDHGTKHDDTEKAADLGKLHLDNDMDEWTQDTYDTPMILETAVHRGTQYGSHPNHPPLVAARRKRRVYRLALRHHFLLALLPRSAPLPQCFDY